MGSTVEVLADLCERHPKFLNKGGLCVALVITETAREKGLPLNPEALQTKERGQVAGLGKAAVQKILELHGIERVLAEEGGRTSRGSLGLMHAYVATLNALHSQNALDLNEAFAWWIAKVRAHFSSEGPKYQFDSGRSLSANIENLLAQAKEVQSHSGGTNYVGAILQHLIGAKLNLVLGEKSVEHHGFSVADLSTARRGDFEIETVVIHVTTHPSESLLKKCAENLRSGFKPLIISLGDGVQAARFLAESSDAAGRIDVLDAVQFLTANVFEHSLFRSAECGVTLRKLLIRYNEIVASCETDPTLLIKVPPE